MKSKTAKAIIKILERNGFVQTRQSGSHVIMVHSDSGTMVPIPVHGKSRQLPIGTFLAVVKQSRIPKKFWK
jgi:predicted RNA binding protein YcfA (HicA-like mRNA interferase family)